MRICLVTLHHVSFQPRTLREADALSAAGHEVRVICRHTDSVLTDYDHELMRSRQWKLQPVELQRNGHSHRQWLVEATRARTLERLFRLGVRSERVAIGSYVRGFRAALEIACAQPADWFIAHTQAALPIAAAGARRWNARLGFDCEDLVSELEDDSPEVVKMIERRYLPACEYISAPSTSMAERLAEQYGVRRPLVLYNVFPLELASGISEPSRRLAGRALRLHWFGQTIGAGRGLEEAIEATRNLGDDVELHLRGRVTDAYRSHLESVAGSDSPTTGDSRAGRPCHIFFHPVVKHDEVIMSMEQFDVGLSLERADHGNYALTITNKLFSYLLAGLAVAATDTPGNREILSQIPSAGFLYQAGKPESLAKGVRRWLVDRVELRQAQQAAWDAARSQFCWDLEKEKFLSLLN